MLEFAAVVGGIVIVATLAIFFSIKHLLNSPNSPAGHSDSALLTELTKLQERERLSTGVQQKHQDELLAATAAIEGLTASLSLSQQAMATSEEKAAGLDKALAREKELNTESQAASSTALTEANRRREQLQTDLTTQSQKLAAAESLEIELRGQIGRANQHITDRDVAINDLRQTLEETRARLATKESDISAYEEREQNLRSTIAERDEQLKGLQDKLKSEFENIANKVLMATSDQLSEKSNETLTAILDPLKVRIQEFQKKVEDTHLEDSKQRTALEREIKHIAEANQTIGLQAEGLAKALKGDSQLRGRWGEVRLERILERSGLVRDREFVIQGGDFNIKSEEGGNQRPDVIILLPEGRHFVVDSKVSLVDYLDYEASEEDAQQAACLKKLLASVRGHIDGLAGKNYQHAQAINSHDLVFMFMPIEGVAALVLQNDDHIFEYAWQRKIVLVSPSTLFMAMQTVQSIWRYEHQSENAQAIAEQAGQLYDKLAGVVGDLNDVAIKIGSAADAHNEAMKKLSSGKGNALGRAQRLKALGVSSKKEIPNVVLDGEKRTVSLDEDDEVSDGDCNLIESEVT
jgi:DNA recombination protein RmuC